MEQQREIIARNVFWN